MVTKKPKHTDWQQIEVIATVEGLVEARLTDPLHEPCGAITQSFATISGVSGHSVLDAMLPAVNVWLQDTFGLDKNTASDLWETQAHGEEARLYYVKPGEPSTHNDIVAAMEDADAFLTAAGDSARYAGQEPKIPDRESGVLYWQAYEALGRVARFVAEARALLKDQDKDRGWNWIARKGG